MRLIERGRLPRALPTQFVIQPEPNWFMTMSHGDAYIIEDHTFVTGAHSPISLKLMQEYRGSMRRIKKKVGIS